MKFFQSSKACVDFSGFPNTGLEVIAFYRKIVIISGCPGFLKRTVFPVRIYSAMVHLSLIHICSCAEHKIKYKIGPVETFISGEDLLGLPMKPNKSSPSRNEKPIKMNITVPIQKSIRFFIRIFPAFLALVKPVSTMAKPACIQNTNAAPIRNHTPYTSLLLSLIHI